MKSKILIVSIVILFCITACASRKLKPIGETDSFQIQEDEKRIWNRSQEEEFRIDQSGHIYDNPEITAYVNEVAQKLIPEDKIDFQIKILKNPLLNAFAYPNSVLYIHTGILSKMENEAQLAALLGHEMTHVTHRHATQNFRNTKNMGAFFATFQVATLPFGIYGSLANILGAVGSTAAVTGYSQGIETEADKEGFALMVNAGYDPHEAPKLFEHLKKEIEEQKVKEPFFFGTHPRLQERINNYNNLIKTSYADKKGGIGRERFMSNILPLLLDNAYLDLSMGRFISAEREINRFLDYKPENAQAHYYLAELYRQRAGKGDMGKAEKEYLLSIQYDPTLPEPHKRIGYIYYKKGFHKEAIAAFEEYLSMKPNSLDRKYIEQYIQEMKNR